MDPESSSTNRTETDNISNTLKLIQYFEYLISEENKFDPSFIIPNQIFDQEVMQYLEYKVAAPTEGKIMKESGF